MLWSRSFQLSITIHLILLRLVMLLRKWTRSCFFHYNILQMLKFVFVLSYYTLECTTVTYLFFTRPLLLHIIWRILSWLAAATYCSFVLGWRWGILCCTTVGVCVDEVKYDARWIRLKKGGGGNCVFYLCT